MLLSNPLLPTILLFIVEVLVYLAVIGMVLRRSVGEKAAAYLTGFYAFFALFIKSVEFIWVTNLVPNTNVFTLKEVHWYGSLSLSFLLFLILVAFVPKEKKAFWVWAGLLWAIIITLFAFNLFRISPFLETSAIWGLDFRIFILGWLGFVFISLFTFRHAYKNTRQTLHRNRLTYWLPIFALLFSADALFINNFPYWGTPLRLLGTWLLGYIVVTHHLPDVHQNLRNILSYIATIIFSGIFYISSFNLAQFFFPVIFAANQIIFSTIATLFVAVSFHPLFSFIGRRIDRWLRLDNPDASQTISKYSKSISNILDMERLANITVSLIMDVMDIQRGFLFLVDKEKKEEGIYYTLSAVRNAGERPISEIWLDENGPIATYLINEQRPLLQFDIDLLPHFKHSHPEEQHWLNNLKTEVYVPIFSKGEWIGLFALGEKLSGNRYTKENLLTLNALAGQTAVALENARLVTNLIDLNKKVSYAHRDLDNTKKDLEKIDRTKSDFISIASHELRTPLTVMRGYTEMLLENPTLEGTVLQMLKGIHEGTLRLHDIMDNLFYIAQIDTKTLQFDLEPINIGKLVRSSCTEFNQAIKERNQRLKLKLPPLPNVQADRETLAKVFYHLISNAIKFTPNEGTITIHGNLLSPNNDTMPAGGIEIIISDTGIGIDPNLKEVIFTKFYQPDDQLGKHSTGKTKFKGSGAGLGLAVSRGIVEAHGGKIWVESPGYDEVNFLGSHFHVVLPLDKDAKENKAIKLTVSM